MIPILLIAAGALLYLLSRQKNKEPVQTETAEGTQPASQPAVLASSGSLPNPSVFEGMDKASLRERFFMYPRNVLKGMQLFAPADNHPEIYAGWAWPEPPAESRSVFESLQLLGSKLNDDSVVALLIQIAQQNPIIHKHVLQVVVPYAPSPKFSEPIFSAKSLTYPFGYQAERQKLIKLGLEECMPRGIAVLRKSKRYVLTFAQRWHFMVFWGAAYIARFGEKVQDEREAKLKLFAL